MVDRISRAIIIQEAGKEAAVTKAEQIIKSIKNAGLKHKWTHITFVSVFTYNGYNIRISMNRGSWLKG